MAINCPNCGREYDAELFRLGRTINCACGARIGFEHRLQLPKNQALKIFADVNAARVVRWLRAIGIDTIWEDGISDAELIKRAISENRFIVTLDKRMQNEWRVDNILLLKSEKPIEQFCEIIRFFQIEKPGKLFVRCLICNALLENASLKDVDRNDVPDAVRVNQPEFFRCPNCDKIYWEGSHTERMQAEIEKVFSNKA